MIFRSSNIDLEDMSTNATGYYILVATSPNGPFTKVNTTPLSSSTTSYTDNTDTPGKVYYYEIQSVNSNSTATTSPIMIAPTPCTNTSNITYSATSQLPASGFQYTTGTITAGSNVNIASGEVTYFWSGSEVQLNPGFSSVNGSTFQAKIVPCSNSIQSAKVNSDLLNQKISADTLQTNANTVINIYPNPTTGTFTIYNNSTEIYNVSVFNISGKLVLELPGCMTIANLDISNLPNGLYIIKVTGTSTSFVGKLVKN